MRTNVNVWGFRVNTQSEKVRNYLFNEILKHRLRQGWGYEDGQKLPKPTVDKGTRRNIAIYNNVKEGDYLLIPHLPSHEMVTLVKATQDFDLGYTFDRNNDWGDFGHIFPVEKISSFNRSNVNITSAISRSLRNRLRFWRMDVPIDDINQILSKKEADLK